MWMDHWPMNQSPNSPALNKLRGGHIPQGVQGQSLGGVSPGSQCLQDTRSHQVQIGSYHHSPPLPSRSDNLFLLLWFALNVYFGVT